MHTSKLTALLMSGALITACGGSSGNPAKTSPNDHASPGSQTDSNPKKQALVIDEGENAPSEMLTQVKKEVESPAFTYLLDTPTAKIRYGIVGSSMISYSGTLSREAKDLVREVWTNLEKKGFSGYDSKELDQENIPFSDGGWHSSPTSPGINKGDEKELHMHLVRKLNDMEESFVGSPHYDGYISTLFGLQMNGKYLVPVFTSATRTNELKDVQFVLSSEIQKDKKGWWNYQIIDPSDIVVTNKQRAEWDQIFIDAIKKHPTLAENLDKKFLTPSDSSDILGEGGTLTSASMRHHQTGGSVHAPEFLSQDLKINAPVHIKLAGNPLEANSSSLGSIFWTANNMLLGVSGASLNRGKNHTQLDASLTSTLMIGQGFFELQGGPISTTSHKANERQWSGYRQAYVLGYDFANGLTPFAQVILRNLETSKKIQENQTSVGLGITAHKEISTPLFKNKLNATAKVGGKLNALSNDFRKTQNGALDYSVNIEHTFKAESVDFSLSMGVGSKQTDNLKLSVIFEQ